MPPALRDRIKPQRPANTRHAPEILQALLSANRKFSDARNRQTAKREILDTVRKYYTE
ncbi:hypothetical protein AB9K34_00715 [Sedimentitalea sp. XS_ASV28]|uniref:hypothetical protein n=1 Tax=Sedimentitalea sp. XS_ASV28 TaxID=3241296 RepID=UPI003518F462